MIESSCLRRSRTKPIGFRPFYDNKVSRKRKTSTDSESDSLPTMGVDPKKRKREAQKRYRDKKKHEMEKLRGKNEEMTEKIKELEPYRIIKNVENVRMKVGKPPRVWVYKETWPECQILEHAHCERALGYRLEGRDCWEYKRFPGLKADETANLKRHWDLNVRKGGYQLHDFLENQFFQRMCYRDGELTWRWTQVDAVQDDETPVDPETGKLILQCVEHDVHDQVVWGMKKGVTDYLASQEANHSQMYLGWFKQNSYTYQVTLGNDLNSGKVSSTSPDVMGLLKWDMTGMTSENTEEGLTIPVLESDMKQIFEDGCSKQPAFYRRQRMVGGKKTLVRVEAHVRVVKNLADEKVIEVLERILEVL